MGTTNSVSLHPIFDRLCFYNDHYEGELAILGDALGRDCMIAAFPPEGPYYLRLFKGDGEKNEDWYSWNAKVYSPIRGEIVKISINEITNNPGIQNPSAAYSIVIRREDGVHVLLGHIRNPQVSEGDTVEEGQLIAYVGNNGYARNPHIHLGAYKDGMPLSIEFDPQKVASVRNRVGENWWFFGNEKPF